VSGTTKPSGSNTGFRTATTSVMGATTITTNGASYNNIRFDGTVTVKAQNVTFTDCHFRGPPNGSTAPLLKAFDSPQYGMVVEFCTFTRQFYAAVGSGSSSTLSAAISGHNMTIRRCDISGSQDGIWVVLPGNANLFDNFIHDLWFYSPDLNSPDQVTHNDLIQLHNGPDNVHIFGNTLLAICDDTLPLTTVDIPGSGPSGGNPNYLDYPDWQGYSYPPWAFSCVMVSPYGAGLSNLVMNKNWMAGGSVCININPNFTNLTASGVVVTNNRWGRIQRGNANGNVLTAKNTLPITMTGNVFEDDSTPYNVRING